MAYRVRVILRDMTGPGAEIMSEDLTNERSLKDLEKIKRAMAENHKTPFYPDVTWLSVASKDILAAHLMPPSPAATKPARDD